MKQLLTLNSIIWAIFVAFFSTNQSPGETDPTPINQSDEKPDPSSTSSIVGTWKREDGWWFVFNENKTFTHIDPDLAPPGNGWDSGKWEKVGDNTILVTCRTGDFINLIVRNQDTLYCIRNKSNLIRNKRIDSSVDLDTKKNSEADNKSAAKAPGDIPKSVNDSIINNEGDKEYKVGDKLDSLTTSDGHKYISVTIREITAEGLSIIHESGVKKIAAKDLPTEMQKSLGIDLDAAEEATQNRITAESAIQKNATEHRIAAIRDLNNTKRLYGKVMQVIPSDKTILFSLYEECDVIAKQQDKDERLKRIKITSDYRDRNVIHDAKNMRTLNYCIIKENRALTEYKDIYSHKCYHKPFNFRIDGILAFDCIDSFKPETVHVKLPSIDGIVDGSLISHKVVFEGVIQYESVLANTKSIRSFRVIPETDGNVIKKEKANQDDLTKKITQERIVRDKIISGKVVEVSLEEKAILVNLKDYYLLSSDRQGKNKNRNDFTFTFEYPKNQYNVWISVLDISKYYDNNDVKIRAIKIGTKTHGLSTLYHFKEVVGMTEFSE